MARVHQCTTGRGIAGVGGLPADAGRRQNKGAHTGLLSATVGQSGAGWDEVPLARIGMAPRDGFEPPT